MSLKTIGGLPAHPLFVHIPIVLLPLVALGVIAMAFSARVRDRLGWVILGLGIVAGLSTQLAVESGQALRHSVARTPALESHIHMGESIRPVALAIFLVGLAIMLVDRRARSAWPMHGRASASAPPAARWAMAVLALLVGVGGVVRLVQVGDSGAKATWSKVKVVSGADRGGR